MNKITFLGPAYPYRGGIATIIERLAAVFAGRGAEINVLTFSMQYPGWLFPGRSQFRGGPPPEGVRIERCVNSLNPLNWLRVGRRIRRDAPDAVILKYWTPFLAPAFGTIARVAKRRNPRTKFLVQLDNIVPHERRWFDGPLTRYFVRGMDGFICMSEQVERELAEFNTTKPRILSPHPIFDHFGAPLPREAAAASLGLDPETRYALFFGLVRPYKGLDMLIEAWASLKPEGRKLIVAGEFYEDVEKYREQVARLGLAGEIIIHDRFIHDDAIPLYFSLADLLVLPYRSATQSGVTQIALHFDMPIVATRVGGLPEIVREGVTGYLADPDPQSLAKTMEKALAHPPSKKGFAAEKKRFSWDAAADALERLYFLTLGSSNP